MPFPAVAARLETAGRHGYRADIDGLRAVAVVPVVLFHAGIARFSGGYVGVDVFFVISGYLITRLIAGEIQRGTFSLARFYERRIRRIFPALFAMLGASLIAGLILFLPRDFENFGRNLVGVAGFVSNIFFWAQTDYFDGPAELKPLLHTWSLAVEEQFYIVFPLFLAWMTRTRPDGGRKAIALIALASFAGSAVAVALEPTTAFYLTPFRAWELLLGSLLALDVFPRFAHSAQRNVAAVAGLALILASVTLYSDLTPFPGLAALLPLCRHSAHHSRGRGGRLPCRPPPLAAADRLHRAHLLFGLSVALAAHRLRLLLSGGGADDGPDAGADRRVLRAGCAVMAHYRAAVSQAEPGESGAAVRGGGVVRGLRAASWNQCLRRARMAAAFSRTGRYAVRLCRLVQSVDGPVRGAGRTDPS
ncbi:acyltransferase family protein [Allosphingosinicella humi]